MNQPLALISSGMISCNAIGAEANAAIMRCGYSNFFPTEFYVEGGLEAQLGATAHVESDLIGLNRLVAMARVAVDGALRDQDLPDDEIAVILGFAEKPQLPPMFDEEFQRIFLDKLSAGLSIHPHQLSSYTLDGRNSFLHAVLIARKRIYEEGLNRVLLLLTDSLLNNHRLSLYEDGQGICRLLRDDNSNGFIPGEAAVALLLSKPDGSEQTCITGIGYGQEKAVIGSGEILRADGLSDAIRNAAEDAGIRVCETDFRISSANGEEYWFKEASLAQNRTLEEKRPSHPLWHPADNIGEVGAAVGGAMVVMGHYAFEKGYAPGTRALCQISNDQEQRGAFILERVGKST